ncbi:MAG: hypothetical protein FJY40_09670 [Betaproteobacteria bacterium]|nr:hypothetical protein [Betaproteobacteria bacterium]
MRRKLERQLEAINAELRSYPTPIARCDEQLAELLELRARLLGRLQRMDEVEAGRPACTWMNEGGVDAA